jgi:hypothetical protein
MNLGARVTVFTTVLVASVLGISAVAALQIRQADLEHDLDREATEVAEALLVALEPVDAKNARATLVSRVWAARARMRSFQIDVLRIGDERVADSGWAGLAEAAEIEDAPVGRIFAPPGRRPFYAMVVPLYDTAGGDLPARDPGRRGAAQHAPRHQLHPGRGQGDGQTHPAPAGRGHGLPGRGHVRDPVHKRAAAPAPAARRYRGGGQG